LREEKLSSKALLREVRPKGVSAVLSYENRAGILAQVELIEMGAIEIDGEEK